MKLDSVDRIPPVAEGHELAGMIGVVAPRADFQFVGQRVLGDDEAVVTRGLERVWQAEKNSSPVVPNRGDLPVHQPIGPDHPAVIDLADALMSQTNAEHRDLRPEMGDDLLGKSGLVGSTRAGRNDDAFRPERLDLPDRDPVVAGHVDVESGVDLTQPLHQVVRERIVVVEYEDHWRIDE